MSAELIYVVRHADAEARGTWTGEDGDRPLTGKGRRQARAVADRFATGPVRDPRRDRSRSPIEPRPVRLVSSYAARCIETLGPLSQALALPVEVEDSLAEGSDPTVALGRLMGLVAAAGSGVVACSHGDVIWGLLTALEGQGVSLPVGADAKKSSIWVLELDQGRVATARYIPPGKV